MTHVGESKDSHIVITPKGEAVVKPKWCGDRIPVFKDSLDENSIDELLISLGAVIPQKHRSIMLQLYVFIVLYPIKIINVNTV
jgi:hypothetical protein